MTIDDQHQTPPSEDLRDIRERLTEARAVLAQRGWSQGSEARDAHGAPCHPGWLGARSWSVTGAIYRASGFDGTPEKRRRYEQAASRLTHTVAQPITRWNDAGGRTRADVLAAFDAAIFGIRVDGQAPREWTKEQTMKVKAVMQTRNLAWVGPEDSIAAAIEIMSRSGARDLPVVQHRRVVGVLGERDLLRHRAQADEERDSDPVATIMSTPAEVVDPEVEVAAAAALMLEKDVSCLPVVDNGELVGLVTPADLLSLRAAAVAAGTPAGSTSREPRVEVAMHRDPFSLPPNAPLVEGIGIMVDQGVRHVPVVDEDRKVVGILSDRDVRTAIGDPLEALHGDLPEVEDLKISGVMTLDVKTVRETAPLSEAAQHFIDEPIGALPVVDADERLVGMVSYADVIWALEEMASPGHSPKPA
jgi:CBS-domain-containing membrane protein